MKERGSVIDGIRLQLPTDNLYKFLALFGLALIVMGVHTFFSARTENNKAVAEWNASWPSMLARADIQSAEAREQLVCAIAFAKAREQKLPYKPTDHCKEIEAREGKSIAEFHEFTIIQAELSGRKEILAFLENQATVAMFGGGLLMVVGFLISTVGFWLWYSRLQRVQDAEMMVRR